MLLPRSIKKLIVLIAILGTSVLAIAQQNPQKPNIVFILADDFGYGSLNSYGTDKTLLRTPHIDRIADEGMRFTNASTPASICSPTRYGFLTGRYPWRSSLKYGVTHIFSELLPDTNRITVADWLSERGYNTAAIGKWHLGYGQLDNNTKEILADIDAPLKNEISPQGIVSFELAKDVNRSVAIMKSWDRMARLSADWSMRFDFLFLIV